MDRKYLRLRISINFSRRLNFGRLGPRMKVIAENNDVV